MDLLERLKNNDMTAFDELYEETSKNVYFVIFSVFHDDDLTRDLLQDTYVKLLEKKDKIPSGTNLGGYVVQIAKNLALNYYNKRKYENEYLSNMRDDSYSSFINPPSGVLEVIKEHLSPKEYKIFLLKVLGEYSFKEISKMTKIPIGTLTWLYQEIRKKLKGVFDDGRK